MIKIKQDLGYGMTFHLLIDERAPKAMTIIGDLKDIDKDFSERIKRYLNLKNPSQKVCKRLINELETYMANIVNTLNGINKMVYPKKIGGSINKSKFVFSKKFMKKSKLNWNKDVAHDIDSVAFKFKFITLILIMLIENIHVYFERLTTDVDEKYKAICKVINQIRYIPQIYISADSYKNSILALQKMVITINNIGKPSKTIESINSLIKNVCDAHMKRFLQEKEETDQDISIDVIIKLAFLLATNNRDFSSLMPFKKIETRMFDDKCNDIIKALGRAIYKSHKEITYPDMFRAFMIANPLMYVGGSKKKSDDLMMGRAALLYTRLVCNSPEVTEIINRITVNK